MPNLLTLNLNGNALTSLDALCGLGSLKKLDVGNNKLEGLSTFPVLPELEVLDANTNLIEANGDKELAYLHECTNLTTLLMAGNPWVDEKGDEFKKEVLIALDMLVNIKQINEMDEVTAEERKEAATEKIEREKARLEREEEERKAAEEAANNPDGGDGEGEEAE